MSRIDHAGLSRRTLLLVPLFLAVPFAAAAQLPCSRWDLSGQWGIAQSNNAAPSFTLQQTGSSLHGEAGYLQRVYEDSPIGIGVVGYDLKQIHGSVDGSIEGNHLELTVYWTNDTIGVYSGQVGPQGRIEGTSFDRRHPDVMATWYSNGTVKCQAVPVPPVEQTAAPTGPVVQAGGRVVTGTPPSAPRPICDVAREARARNSPAAAGLEAQCRAQQEAAAKAPPPAALPPIDVRGLAARGEAIASVDPLAADLRAQQPDDLVRLGFDIGMAAAEKDTSPGPGKQRIHDSLGVDEQKGFDNAVAFSLERNQNADLARTGAAIVAADALVATARNVDPNVFYRLGFDIATGIFGDPALGASGNTATGPGSLKIRDALSAAGRRGFNASVAFHLRRDYTH